MLEKKATIYVCEFCGKRAMTRSTIFTHEARCWYNPNRRPMEGELLQAWALSKFETPPLWWPKDEQGNPLFGRIYDGETWLPVPGHRLIDWNDDFFYFARYEDRWPELDGKPFNRVPGDIRLDLLARLEETVQK
jgi:hypothetical protein